MKKQSAVIAAALICLCMTGCSGRDQLTKQKDDIPTFPAETGQIRMTEEAAAGQTEAVTALTGTDIIHTEAASVTSRTVSVTEAAETAAPAQTKEDNAGTPASREINSLYGKWETVSFKKSTGESTAYDLSDDVHRSYYVGLDLRSSGQSELTVGTAAFPATIAVNGNTLSVWKVNSNSGSMNFQVSDDKTRMTVVLMDGRITATLKPVRTDFSIKPYQNSAKEPDCPFSASDLTGEWAMPGTFGTRNNSIHVSADGSVILRYAAGGSRRGKIQIDREDQPDGTCSYLYALCDDTGTSWMRFPCAAVSADHLYSEQDGAEYVRLTLADIAVGKMNSLTFLMSCMNGGGGDLEIDRESTVTAGDQNAVYALVTDERFSINSFGKAALERLLEETASGDERKHWADMIDYSFLEQDGQTYVRINETHGHYIFDTEHGVTVKDQTETSFTAATNASNQMYGRGSAHFVFDGTNWTIESYEFN